jgi:rubredoxin
LESYECNICGYIYEPGQGDPNNGIPGGTQFEQLPNEWTCPVCGAGKEEFSPIP